ncbi:50S ribosomal protein L23 [Buchnera aphidicola (Mollitrichosiphum nigrofasciatum)]|uniref:50S ribosomal protein L23 n=1 Tax=Buchnera aphidicola TaxID=9 RepID=UPI0031B81EF3
MINVSHRSLEILLSPHISEKSTVLIEKLNTLVLKVVMNAKKIEIKKAVQQIFNVKVKNINIVLVKGKKKKSGKDVTFRKNWKKAYISLYPGHNLNIINNQE